MKSSTLLRVAVLSIAVLASRAFAQMAPEEVGDDDIAALQSSIESGCVNRGLQRHDPEPAVRKFCSCITTVLQAKVPKTEWQEGIVAASTGDRSILTATLARHQGEMGVCRAR